MRQAAAAVLALLGGGLVVVTVGAYVFSTFCWEYCEPEGEPTVWEGPSSRCRSGSRRSG